MPKNDHQPLLTAPSEGTDSLKTGAQVPAGAEAGNSEPAKAIKPRGKPARAKTPGPVKQPQADWPAIQKLIDSSIEAAMVRVIENEKAVAIEAAMERAVAKERVIVPTEPRTPLIFGAIRNIMRGIEPLAKLHEHEQQGFFFRTIDEVCALLQPLFVEHGLFCVPEVLEEREIERIVRGSGGDQWVNIHTKVRVRWHLFCAIDGSSLPHPCVTMGEGVSEMHFSTAAAQTMAFKQMLWEVFAIPVRGVDDPEGDTVERSMGTAPKEVYVTPQQTQTQPNPSAPGLFDNAEEDFGDTEKPEKKKRGPRAPLEPQTTEAGIRDEPPAAEEPLTAGFIKMLQSSMQAKGCSEAELFAHFEVQDWTGIKKSQMAYANAWLANYTKGA
jgi:hypothetical protein